MLTEYFSPGECISKLLLFLGLSLYWKWFCSETIHTTDPLNLPISKITYLTLNVELNVVGWVASLQCFENVTTLFAAFDQGTTSRCTSCTTRVMFVIWMSVLFSVVSSSFRQYWSWQQHDCNGTLLLVRNRCPDLAKTNQIPFVRHLYQVPFKSSPFLPTLRPRTRK